MTYLTVFQHNSINVVDSRQVAEMTGKQHKHLLRDIAGYIEVLSLSAEPKIGPSDFFIESSYKDSTGRTLPCYLLTKKGCDMVANKMTGEKGVLFTAAYVTAFEAMHKRLQDESKRIADTDSDLRLKIMAMNARSRAASQMTRLWTAAGVKPADQALALNGYFDGLALPREAFGEVCAHLLDATAIAAHLGILSTSGKPHNQAVAALIGTLTLEEGECALTPYSKGGHDGVSAQYTTSVEDKVRAWLEANGWPEVISAGGKRYGVVYQIH